MVVQHGGQQIIGRPNGVHVVLFGENYEQKAEMNGVEGWWEATLTLPEQAGALTLVKQYNYGKIKVSRYERGEEV